MRNHIHLLVKMGEVDLGKIFQAVHMKYSRYFNMKRNTQGHVFQGRPGMKIILSDRYIRQLIIYLHKNPVRAGLVKKPDEYMWSSDSLFRGKQMGWIKLKSWRFPPGFEENNCVEQYRELIDEEPKILPEDIAYIGTREEYDEIEKRKAGRGGRRYRERREKRNFETIIKEICCREKITLKDLRGRTRIRKISKLRHKAMAMMYEEGYSVVAIGKYFNRTPNIVVKACGEYTGISILSVAPR